MDPAIPSVVRPSPSGKTYQRTGQARCELPDPFPFDNLIPHASLLSGLGDYPPPPQRQNPLGDHRHLPGPLPRDLPPYQHDDLAEDGAGIALRVLGKTLGL